MESLTLLVALSTVLWYCIDRFKPMWADLSWGKYLTMIIAAVGSFGLVFGFGLDLVCAVGLVEEVTIIGQILTGLVLMGGSSAISEVISKIKK